MTHRLKQFIQNSSLLFVAAKSLLLKLAGAGTNFLVGILLARLLGAKEFGIYSLVLSIVMLLGMLASLGKSVFYTRETAILNSKGQVSAVVKIRRFADIQTLFASFVLILVGYSVIEFNIVGVEWGSVTYSSWAFVALIIPLFSFNVARAAILRGLNRVILADFPDILLKPLLIILFLLCFYLSGNEFDSSLALIFQFLSYFLVFVIYAFYLRCVLPVSLSNTGNNVELKQSQSSFVFFMISCFSLLQTQLPFYFVGYYLEPQSAGLYQACLQVVNILVLGLTAVNSPLQPKLAAAWEQGDKQLVQSLVLASVKIASGIAVVAFLLIFLLADYILSLYGSTFIEANFTLKLLLIGQLINALCGPCALLLIMTRRQNIVLVVFFFSILLGAGIGSITIPIYGINGAAVMSIIVILFWNMSMSLYCLNKLKINTILPVKLIRRVY